MKKIIYTIGHSTLEIEKFIDTLKAYEIEKVVDVRSLPGSKKFPQFDKENLEKSLKKSGIGYEHFKLLGGLRRTSKDSINKGWRNSSFRGFADYMQSPDFAEGVEKLILEARKSRVVIMCAEALPWRCHRSLIGDALLVRGWKVENIFTDKKIEEHEITEFAKVKGKKIWYPED